jgi:outer membrane receptor protein involved in Fe transport
MNKHSVAGLTAVIGICLQMPAYAERIVEEIVVTATKREQSIQDIPIAVSAFSGADLSARGITEVDQLMQVSPSLFINTSNSSTNGGTMRIRGIGTTGNNVGLESAVGFFVDGVYRSRSGQALNDLVDVERVEVLRGPQGTLFGKNTSAGAVHVITKKPEWRYGGTAGIGAGNLSSLEADASFTGPLIEDALAFRIAGSYRERDGYYDDIDSSDEYSDRDRYSLKGQLLWTPTDTLTWEHANGGQARPFD